MRAGHQFKGKVRDISVEGYGVTDHPDGFVFFVLGTFPGDEGHFEIVHLKDRYGYAKVLQLTQLSSDRISVPCEHSGLEEGLCGGCPWMSIRYERQLELKHHMLTHALVRDHLWPKEQSLPPIWPSPLTFGFRNRAQFKTDGVSLGYVSRFSRTLAPIKDCVVLNTPLRNLVQTTIKSLPIDEWKPTPPHSWSYIDLDDETTLETIVPNRRRPFKQANSQQNQRMREWVREKTTSWNDKSVLELFCGSGNFTEILVQGRPRQLIATDIASTALNKLKAMELGPQCTIIESNVFKPGEWKHLKAFHHPFDCLFLDPPREGFPKLDLFVSQFGFPKQILYISCSLASFVHDAGRLKKKGYRILELEGLDQFPHTPHIEILALLVHRSAFP